MRTHKINGATRFRAADPARDQTITSHIARHSRLYVGPNRHQSLHRGPAPIQNPDGVPNRGFDPESQLGLKGTSSVGSRQ